MDFDFFRHNWQTEVRSPLDDRSFLIKGNVKFIDGFSGHFF